MFLRVGLIGQVSIPDESHEIGEHESMLEWDECEVDTLERYPDHPVRLHYSSVV